MSEMALPESWQMLPLKFATEDFQNGVWGTEPNGGSDDILCARVADFDRSRLEVTDIPTVRRVSQKDRDRCSLQRGDILVEKSGGTDRNPVGTVVSYQSDAPAVYANFIFRLRLDSRQDQRFWLYALHGSYLDGRTWSLVRQTTGIQNLDTNGFMSMKHPAPPLATQHRIADYLDRETGQIDAMIDKLDDLSKELHSRKSAFLDSAFDDLYGKMTVPLWSILKSVKDQGFPDEEVLSVYRDYGVILKSSRDDNLNRTPENLNPYQLVLPGDVVVNKMKAWQGSLGVSEYRGIVSPDYQVARPMTDLDPRYIHSVLRTPRMISHYRNRSIGVRPAQWRLYWGEMSTLHIPLPPLEEQRRIADLLDDVTSKIDAMLAKVAELKDLLTERRAALITDVVTGRKDVA